MTARHHLPVLAPSSLRADGSRAFAYTADTHGRFTTARRVVFAALIAVYAALALALSAGSAVEGAMAMLAFGLGTLPMLLAMSAAAGALWSLVRRAPVRRGVGLALGLMGALSLVAVCRQSAAFLHPPAPGMARAHCHDRPGATP